MRQCHWRNKKKTTRQDWNKKKSNHMQTWQKFQIKFVCRSFQMPWGPLQMDFRIISIFRSNFFFLYFNLLAHTPNSFILKKKCYISNAKSLLLQTAIIPYIIIFETLTATTYFTYYEQNKYYLTYLKDLIHTHSVASSSYTKRRIYACHLQNSNSKLLLCHFSVYSDTRDVCATFKTSIEL